MAKSEIIPDSLKQNVRQMIKPLAEFFLKLGISPNTMTVIGVLLSIVSAVLFATKSLYWGGIIYMLAGFCDIFDGAMARMQNRGTSFGAFLDSTLDRMAEAFALLGVMVYFHRIGDTPMIYITYLAVTASMLVSYSKARSEGLGQECNVGWLERPERVTLVVAGVILGGHLGLKIAMFLMMIFAYITVGQRMHHTYLGFKEKTKIQASKFN